MKTPEEIKKGLECGSEEFVFCGACPYKNAEECNEQADADALAYIRKLEAERDALKADILRATDKAHEMQSVLDNDVHPNCDYGLYCDLCDALGDVVAWEHKELLDTTPEEE